MKTTLIVITVLFIFLGGCAASKEASRQDTGAPTGPGQGIVEDVDPATLAEVGFKIDRKESDRQTATRRDFLGRTVSDTLDKGAESQKIPGYRIQIGSVSDQEDALEIQQDAIMQFENTSVYLIYETPYYKVRVGDYERRRDAEELQQLAVELGYGEAWIVRTIVTKRDESFIQPAEGQPPQGQPPRF